MSSDAPQDEPARTRRSARTAPTPVQATDAGHLSRAELRRRAAQAGKHDTAATGDRTSDAPAIVPAPDATVSTRFADDAAPVFLTRRQRRLITGPTPIVADEATDDAIALGAAAIAVPADTHVDAEARVDDVQATPATAASAHDDVDEFTAAAKLFAFTGQTRTPGDEAPGGGEDADDADADAGKKPEAAQKHTARRRTLSTRSLKRMAAASVSFSAIVAVGVLTVGMTMPSAAVATADTQLTGASTNTQPTDVTASADDEIQAYVAPADTQPVAEDLDRTANYSTTTLVEMAGTTGISNVSNAVFTNNAQCDVQWPFAVGVPISFGFGPRPGEFHEGVDFTPGYGAHVQAIADGTVRVAQEGYQGYGVAVIIDHVIDGQHVASLYGHMQYGSLQVHPGEKVQVGQYIGRTGNTGYSFGAHTHVEIRQNGVTPIDPLPWLRAHNKC